MRLSDLPATDQALVWESIKNTVRQIALTEVQVQNPKSPDDMAWVIGQGAKNCLVQMRRLGILPEDFLFGDITVDYPRNVAQPKFRIEVHRLP